MTPTNGLIRSLAKEFAAAYSKEKLTAMRDALLQAVAAGGKRVTTWSDMGISSTAYYELDTPTQLLIVRKALFLKNGGRFRKKTQDSFFA